jgi:hypothetical protein
MRVGVAFEDWVVGVFDPTVEDPWPPVAQELDYLTRLFSDPVGVLEGLSDEEIGDARIACVHTIRNLYRELFVPRCAERLGHLSEQGGRLEMICYMFWDVAVFGGPPGEREGNLFEDAVLDVLEDALYLEHAACQESAIHGLGHRVRRHAERAPAILDRRLRRGPLGDPRLRPYAEAARTGCIQ